MEEQDIVEFIRRIPFFPDAKDRVNNEINRMKADMETLLSTWSVEQIRAVFTGPIRYRCRIEQLQGETLTEKCNSALRIGGLTFLTDAIYLSDFDMAERLRQTKLNVFSQLITRDQFFRPKDQEDNKEKAPAGEQGVSAVFDILCLPAEIIGQIMQQSVYQDAQNLAISCRATNTIYRNNCANMDLPDIVLILGFSNRELTVRWFLEKEYQEAQGDPDVNTAKILIQNKENERKKYQLLKNTTLLKVMITDEFDPEYCYAVLKFIGDRKFKRLVVKGDEYTENVKTMVEALDKEYVEMEVNKFTAEFIPFPDIKTIIVRDNLNRDNSERLFSAKQFVNITCALINIDSFRKALFEWDNEQREIGKWVILKQFTIFQTPFGRRHRKDTCQRKGYLEFISELNSSQMPHGEVTEYVFHPTE